MVVHQLRDCGFGDITLAVGYLAHLVRAVMGDGTRHGVHISYNEETEPLGTVGPLAEIEDIDDTFLVMNGDVLTALDYGHLMDVHRESGNVLTIASHRRVVRTEYGVLHYAEQSGNMLSVSGFEEKPEIPYVVSMGVYVLEPSALEYIESGPVPRPSRPRCCGCSRRAARLGPTCTTGTGSTSDVTRITRRH